MSNQQHAQQEPPAAASGPADHLAQVHQDFAYAVSHDLGAPLRQIASYVELLQMSLGDRLNERERMWLGHLVQAADTSQSMLRGLLRYSRLATRAEHPQAIPLEPTLARAVALTEGADQRVRVTVPELTVNAVAAQLRTLVQELVANALRHSDSTSIELTAATTDGDGLRLLVSDHGRGVSAQQRQEALQLFAVLDRGHQGAGMGLGLPLCQRIMQLHGGDLELQDTPGGGLTVACSFPRGTVLAAVADAG